MKALIGTIGIASLEGVQAIPTNGTPTSEIVKIVVQVIIGIISIFHIVKKPKTDNNAK